MNPMNDKIRAGKILVKQDALVPEVSGVVSEPYAAGWLLLKNVDGYGLGKKVRVSGGSFSPITVNVTATRLGLGKPDAIRRAVERLIAGRKSEKLNCLEITKTTSRRILGLFSVTVSAGLRTLSVEPPAENSAGKNSAGWNAGAKLASA